MEDARGRTAHGPLPRELPAGATGSDELRPELADVGRLARRALRAVVGAARAEERPTLSRIVVEHLGPAARDSGVVEETWRSYDHVNVQAGLDAWLSRPGRASALVGVVTGHGQPVGLAELLAADGRPERYGPRPGNAAGVNVACGPDGQVRPCVLCGLYLVTEGDRRTVVLLRAPAPEFGRAEVSVQIACSDSDAAARAAPEIRAAALEHNVFRGQVLSSGSEIFGHGQTLLQFHRRPAMGADQLVLSPATLAEVQRQVVEVARHKDRLLTAGQHLKRGVLLYGRPAPAERTPCGT